MFIPTYYNSGTYIYANQISALPSAYIHQGLPFLLNNCRVSILNPNDLSVAKLSYGNYIYII